LPDYRPEYFSQPYKSRRSIPYSQPACLLAVRRQARLSCVHADLFISIAAAVSIGWPALTPNASVKLNAGISIQNKCAAIE
jgi:hypothetical protein